MFTRSFMLTALLAGCAATASELTPLEKQKLDPALQSLVLGAPASPSGFDTTTSYSGETLYGVIARTDDPESIRNAGFEVSSAMGGVAVVRVTVAQLRALVKLASVRGVANGSRNRTQ